MGWRFDLIIRARRLECGVYDALTNYAWQQRIIKLARRIIDIEIRARKSAQAKGKEAEVEQAVPSTDDDITEEETDNPAN
ncbi:hypothetical protein FORC55_2119 [Vibrio cholerae]|nr:hypothetical protein FORC55_2119 [Vibrio cholerae]